MTKLIIFDLDGVLVEAKQIHYDTLNQALREIDEKYVITEAEHLSIYDGLKTTQKLELLTKNKGLHPEFYDKLIVTMSGKGCKYMEKEFNVEEVEVRDNSGAGDSFISALAIEYCRTKDIDKSIVYANECATIAVQHKGVTKVGKHIKIY